MKKLKFSPTVINLLLRLISLGSKFLLIIFIGKNLSITELGEYGLFVTGITFSIYILGFDFYNFNTREIIEAKDSQKPQLIRDQFVFHIIMYVLFLPLLFSLFTFQLVDVENVFLFILILIFEHLSQELFRILISLKKDIQASFTLFIRSGLWVFVLLTLWFNEVESLISLSFVWICWSIGSFISTLVAITFIARTINIKAVHKKIDWAWIKNGVSQSLPFFVGTIAYKIIEFSDRFMIDTFMSKADVGVYSFFYGIANVMNIIVFSAVIMRHYPVLIEHFQNEKFSCFNKQVKLMMKNVLLYSLGTAVMIIFFIGNVLEYMGKSELSINIDVLYYLLLGSLVLNVSLVPHYVLYSAKQDKIIRNATLIGTLLNVALNLVLINQFGLLGAAISTIISFLYIGIHKEFIVRNVISISKCIDKKELS